MCTMTDTAKDHPRTCGEHWYGVKERIGVEGSPPHLRGALSTPSTQVLRNRITPAPAGSTGLYLHCPRSLWDHPRTCGEHSSSSNFPILYIGSPPHLRGAPHCKSLNASHFRITPAPAGSTRLYSVMYCASKDHPRTCGEHRRIDLTYTGDSGSPPHLRGALKLLPSTPTSLGITPAPAGSTY